jgi:cystathionine gamma-lyase
VSNPTRAAAEQCLAALENARYGLLFASGMAAEVALLGLLRPGDHVVCTRDVYGGTISMWKHLAPQRGVSVSYANMLDLDATAAAIQPNTRMLWLESPTNPLTYVLDIPALAELGHRHNLLVVIDNTFATPYLQNPLEMGVDVVVHSVTKYLGGHSDILGGALAFNRDDLYEPLWDQQAIGGAVLSPFESWLLLRGMKTLAVRMRAHCENATAGRTLPRRASKGGARAVPWLARPPAARVGETADARLRRDACRLPQDRPRRGRPLLPEPATV